MVTGTEFFFYNPSLFSFYSLWKSGKQAISLVKHKYELLLAWKRQVFYILSRMAFCISDFYVAIFQNVLVRNAYWSSLLLLYSNDVYFVLIRLNNIIMKQIFVIHHHRTIYIRRPSRNMYSDLCIVMNVCTRVVGFYIIIIFWKKLFF